MRLVAFSLIEFALCRFCRAGARLNEPSGVQYPRDTDTHFTAGNLWVSELWPALEGFWGSALFLPGREAAALLMFAKRLRNEEMWPGGRVWASQHPVN